MLTALSPVTLPGAGSEHHGDVVPALGRDARSQMMDQAHINGVTLDVLSQGTGEPVMLIQPGVIADAYAPLFSAPVLAERYRLVTFHRRGFAGSSHPQQPASVAEQAADTKAVLQYFGITQAHVVGHSYGGAVALQLALDGPAMVHSLALLEPALLAVPSAAQFGAAMTPVVEAYAAGKRGEALDGFLQAVAGPNYRSGASPALPADWYEQALADLDALFQADLPGVQQWPFTEELAQRITQPALVVLGADSETVAPMFPEGYELL
jgi:pimeloyl-ACP methyl ester carboxylesterase